MKRDHKRRIAAVALATAVSVGGGLLAAAPAGAVSQVGGIGCHTNGVTVFEGFGYTAVGCFAGSAGTVDTSLAGTGSVMGVWNHGYTNYITSYNTGHYQDVTGFAANGVHYRYDDQDSWTYAVTIQS
jgi:hypothetical protein